MLGRNGISIALALVLVALGAAVAAGCGDEDIPTTTVTAAEEGTTPEEAAGVEASDMEAIESTIKTWLLQGDCALMSDGFLEEQTFIDQPAKACETFESGFTAPSYSEDEIEVSDIAVVNGKASATVGGGGDEITSTYQLVLADDGTWQIASVSID